MILLLTSCLGLIAIGLLGMAAWMYFNQKQKDGSETKNQYVTVITAGLGFFACFLAVVLLGVYIWGFMNF